MHSTATTKSYPQSKFDLTRIRLSIVMFRFTVN